MTGADLRGEYKVAEACLRGGGQDEEEHDGAVNGDQGEVVFGQNGAVERKWPCGPDEVDSHEERKDGAYGHGEQGEGEVLEADDAVVGGEESSEDEARLWVSRNDVALIAGVGRHGVAAFRFEASQDWNWSGETTRRVAFMR